MHHKDSADQSHLEAFRQTGPLEASGTFVFLLYVVVVPMLRCKWSRAQEQ